MNAGRKRKEDERERIRRDGQPSMLDAHKYLRPAMCRSTSSIHPSVASGVRRRKGSPFHGKDTRREDKCECLVRRLCMH